MGVYGRPYSSESECSVCLVFGTSCQGCRCSESNVFLSTVLCELHVSVLKSTFLKWKHSPVFVNGLWKRVATYLFYGSAINDAKYNKSDLQNTINCLRSIHILLIQMNFHLSTPFLFLCISNRRLSSRCFLSHI